MRDSSLPQDPRCLSACTGSTCLRLCLTLKEAAWWEGRNGTGELVATYISSPWATSPGDDQAITHLMTSPGALSKQHAPPGSHAQLTRRVGA